MKSIKLHPVRIHPNLLQNLQIVYLAKNKVSYWFKSKNYGLNKFIRL